jgi:hypothetical protein
LVAACIGGGVHWWRRALVAANSGGNSGGVAFPGDALLRRGACAQDVVFVIIVRLIVVKVVCVVFK